MRGRAMLFERRSRIFFDISGGLRWTEVKRRRTEKHPRMHVPAPFRSKFRCRYSKIFGHNHLGANDFKAWKECIF